MVGVVLVFSRDKYGECSEHFRGDGNSSITE